MRKQLGFSILEPLVAISLLTITLLGISIIVIYSIKLSQLNKLREEAIYKASKLVNYLSSLPFNSPCLTEGNHACQLDNGTCCNDLRGDANTEYFIKSVNSDLKEIQVIVKFQYNNLVGHVSISRLKGNWQ